MSNSSDEVYRTAIDALAETCRRHSATAPRWLDDGVWNVNATPEYLPEQHRITVLLQGLSRDDRQLLADLLNDSFVGGIHESLAVLYQMEVSPFDAAYEGAPFNDFIGRLDDWEWPDGPRYP